MTSHEAYHSEINLSEIFKHLNKKFFFATTTAGLFDLVHVQLVFTKVLYDCLADTSDVLSVGAAPAQQGDM